MYRTLNFGQWLGGSIVALALAAATPGAAQSPLPKDEILSFPASLEPTLLTGWLKRETDITAGSVVAVSPLALVSIMQTQPVGSPEGFEVTVRAEILDGDFSRREHLGSWHATMKLACKDRTLAMGDVTGHAARNLMGDGHSIQTAQGWRPVVAGTMQGEIWAARCDKDFVGPLVGGAAKTPAASLTPPQPAVASPPVIKQAPVAPPPLAKALQATLPKAAPPTPPVVAPPPAARPAPAAMLKPATPAAPPPPKPSAPKPAPAPKPVASAKGPTTSAQILSAPTADEAARALTRLKTRLGDAMSGLDTSVVAVQTDGKTRYRAIVSGFRASGEAAQFCAKLPAGKCLARNDAGRAASEKAP